MKKILLPFLLIFIFSCGPNRVVTPENEGNIDPTNPYEVADSLLIEGDYLIFLNESKFAPLMKTTSPTFEGDTAAIRDIEYAKVAAIKDYARKYHLEIDESHIYIDLFSGFFVRDLSEETVLRMLSDKANVTEAHQNFFMQNTRARMQGDGEPIPQNARARMQENPDWGYDTVAYTSKAVTYLGGGIAGPTSSKIWIIDSGIERGHQDLAGQVMQSLSRSFVQGGLNPTADADPLNDFWGHGTFCAGLAAAKPANESNPNQKLLGMTGVSRGAKLVSLKVFGQDPRSEYLWIVEAMNYAAGRNRLSPGDVMSLSLGGKVGRCVRTAFINALDNLTVRKSIFLVFAACNGSDFDGEEARLFLPACIEGDRMFTIGSVDLNYLTGAVSFSAFSNYGMPPIDWVVPGDHIFSTYPRNQYAVMQGISMSTALFAGLLHLTGGQLRRKTDTPGINGEDYSYPIPMK